MDKVDLLIRGGTILDGTGAARYQADIAVNDGRIVQIGMLADCPRHEEIDAGGHIVAPGFIDVHTHDDRMVLASPMCEPKVSQGVTTVVTGNCGVSLAPFRSPTDIVTPPLNLLSKHPGDFFENFGSYLRAVEMARPAVNVLPLVGHMSLRCSVMPDTGRPANASETEEMAGMLRAAMMAGAAGFSTGLAYPPSRAADRREIAALAAVAGEFGGIYTTHLRDEANGISASLDEAFETARLAKAELILSHHKCLGPDNWGRSRETLDQIDLAKAKQPIALDAYPYTYSSTILLPEKLRTSLDTVVTWSTPHPEMAGRRIKDIAAAWECSVYEAAERLVPAGAIYFNMSEDDVDRILAHPCCMVGSDGLPHDTRPHPRLWGTFARVLGRYVREKRVLTLEDAVYKMTGLTASTLRLGDRGILCAGYAADICIFSAEAVADQATIDAPSERATGISHVIVNGRFTLRDGRQVQCGGGQVLQREPPRAAERRA